MKKFNFDDEITGEQYWQTQRPCIYAWFRGQVCLYVGKSLNGICRPLSLEHHIINRSMTVLPTDTIKLFWCSVKNDRELLDIECKYIKKLKPRFNSQFPNAKADREKLWNGEIKTEVTNIHQKHKLQKELFGDNSLLLDPCLDSVDPELLTTEQLKQRISLARQAQGMLHQYGKA